MGLSISQNIHIANAMGQDAHVMVGLTSGWQLADFLVTAAELAAACADVAALPEAAGAFLSELPAEVETLGELAQFTKTIATFAYKLGRTGNALQSGVNHAIDTFRKSAICVPAGQEMNVSHMDLSSILLPSTIASFAGADTIQLVILSQDNNFQVSFDSGADDSWVLTDGRYFPRAKYGKLWVQDQSEGYQFWDACSLQTHLEYQQYWLNYYQSKLAVLQSEYQPGHTFAEILEVNSMIHHGMSVPVLKSYVSQYQAAVSHYKDLIQNYG